MDRKDTIDHLAEILYQIDSIPLYFQKEIEYHLGQAVKHIENAIERLREG